MTTERLKLTVAYDGAPFDGWQSQATANGVQDHIEAAFLAIGGVPLRIHGSGRTDAGVHATGQIAHADVPRGKLSPATWMAALNANLPDSIRITLHGPVMYDEHFGDVPVRAHLDLRWMGHEPICDPNP